MTLLELFAFELRRHFGITYPAARNFALAYDLERLVAVADAENGDEVVAALQGDDPKVVEAAARVCTVGETYFFRERAALEGLRAHLSDAATALHERGPVRIWSAACSTGEEAYTLAFIASDVIGPEGWQVIGTDVNEAALARARRARYRPWAFRGVSDDTRERWFVARDDGTWEVRAEVRARVSFTTFNLLRAPPPQLRGFDAIFCCNALLYFPRDAIEDVGASLIASLGPEGVLFLGASDPTLERQGHRHLRGAAHAYGATPVASPRSIPTLGREPEPEQTMIRRRTSRPPASPGPSSTTPPPPAADPADVGIARAALDRGDDETALPILDRVLRDAPTAEGFLLRASSHRNHGNLAGALTDIQKALYLDRDLALAHAMLALVLGSLGRHVEAARALRHARALLQDVPRATSVPASGNMTAHELSSMLDTLERSTRKRGRSA